MKRVIFICAVAVASITVATAQEYPDLTGFTKSPTEHVINVVEKPFLVRSIRGEIQFRNGPLEPLADVVFEIRGPGADKEIRRTTTDGRGRFKIRHARSGTYKFKTTLNGYKSSVGTIIVSKNADQSDIRIEMDIGN